MMLSNSQPEFMRKQTEVRCQPCNFWPLTAPLIVREKNEKETAVFNLVRRLSSRSASVVSISAWSSITDSGRDHPCAHRLESQPPYLFQASYSGTGGASRKGPSLLAAALPPGIAGHGAG